MTRTLIQLTLILHVSSEVLALSINTVKDGNKIPTLNLVESSINRRDYELRSRLGEPTEESRCQTITDVPKNLHFITKYGFYKKYTDAYGIPIISSKKVSDAALKRACEVIQIMLADQHAIRWYVYKNYGRIGIIATEELTTTIPEHSSLSPYYNKRARGLGGTLRTPIATVGEENLLCTAKDRHYNEDILVHEFAHSIMELALMRGALPGIVSKLQKAYEDSLRVGRWKRTYAATNVGDYFAEGVQSYFDCNVFSKEPNGVHNHVSTRIDLKRYDRPLYTLIREVFPCGNRLRPRCSFGPQKPHRMDCPVTHFNPQMDLSYLYSNDYETEMRQEEEEPLILNPSMHFNPPIERAEERAKTSNRDIKKERYLDTEDQQKRIGKKADIDGKSEKLNQGKLLPGKKKESGELALPESAKKLLHFDGNAGKTTLKKKLLSKNSKAMVRKGKKIITKLDYGYKEKQPGKVTKSNKTRTAFPRTSSSPLMDSTSTAKNKNGQSKSKDIQSGSIENGVCEDKGWYCNYYVIRDACKGHLDWMYENCRKSCGLCNLGKVKVCRDSDPSCYIWALYGHCENNRLSFKHMQELCPRTCKFCT